MVSRAETRRQGFTVVELIVAMTISAITLLSGYELFETIKQVSDREDMDMAADAELVHGLHILREDLLHAVGRMESEEPIFVGSDPANNGEAETTVLLEFYALCPVAGEDGMHEVRQMHRIRYELDRGAETLGLYRSIASVVAAGQGANQQSRQLVLANLQGIQISFYDGQTARRSFSSNQVLPIGVDVTVMAYDRAWPLTVRVPCGSPEEQQ